MQPIRGVLARVLMVTLSLALVAGIIVAARPASAAGRRADALADAAVAALVELSERRQVQAAVIDQVLRPDDPAALAAETAWAEARWLVATMAGPRGGVDAVALNAVWASTTDQRLVALFSAISQVGVPYRGRRSVPGVGFDCSGLTTWAWAQAGVALPRSSSTQIRSVAPKPLDQVLPGDLVQYPGHVMMSLGLGSAMVHSPRSGETVAVEPWHRARRAGSPVG